MDVLFEGGRASKANDAIHHLPANPVLLKHGVQLALEPLVRRWEDKFLLRSLRQAEINSLCHIVDPIPLRAIEKIASLAAEPIASPVALRRHKKNLSEEPHHLLR